MTTPKTNPPTTPTTGYNYNNKDISTLFSTVSNSVTNTLVNAYSGQIFSLYDSTYISNGSSNGYNYYFTLSIPNVVVKDNAVVILTPVVNGYPNTGNWGTNDRDQCLILNVLNISNGTINCLLRNTGYYIDRNLSILSIYSINYLIMQTG